MIANGHGGPNHVDVIERLKREYNETTSTRVITVHLCSPPKTFHGHRLGHAATVETSIMMATNPDSVDLEQLPAKETPLSIADYAIVDNESCCGNPTSDRSLPPGEEPRLRANSEIGREIIEFNTEWVCETVTNECGR